MTALNATLIPSQGFVPASQLAGVKRWTKSSRSGAAGHCVEVAPVATGVVLRNSKAPETGALAYTRPEWEAFRDGVKAGEFDLI